MIFHHLTLLRAGALAYTVFVILCVLRLWPWEKR